ncbi:MAG: hypothetical protein WCG04_05985 [Alphaproteobacteria bacterium]
MNLLCKKYHTFLLSLLLILVTFCALNTQYGYSAEEPPKKKLRVGEIHDNQDIFSEDNVSLIINIIVEQRLRIAAMLIKKLYIKDSPLAIEKLGAQEGVLLMLNTKEGSQQLIEKLKTINPGVQALLPQPRAVRQRAIAPHQLPAALALHSQVTSPEEQKIEIDEGSYRLSSVGPEEKWRWRNNFKILFKPAPEANFTEVDFAPVHKILREVGNDIEGVNTVFFKTDEHNVVVPAISIIYENNEGQIKCEDGYIPDISPRGISENKVVFLSGLGKRSLPAEHKIEGQNFQIKIGVIQPQQVMEGVLLKNYAIPKVAYDNILDDFRIHTTDLINNKKYDEKDSNFGTYFYHSEQWLIAYLAADYMNIIKKEKKPYYNLCAAIHNILDHKNGQVKKIHEIIFHIASKHDICDVCSPTLSVFLENLEAAKANIVGMLKGIILPEGVEQDIVSENLGFFIIASSYRPDISQSKLRTFYVKKFSDYGDRRHKFGLDSAIASPTLIGPGILKYIQVPVDQVGNPLDLLPPPRLRAQR